MSFRLKLFISLIVGQVLVLVGTGLFGLDVMQKLARIFIVERGTENATLLAATLAEPLLFFDLSRIDEALTAVALDPSVTHAAAYDMAGRLVSYAGPSGVAANQLDPAVFAALPMTEFDAERRYHFVPIRIGDENIGVLCLAVIRTDLMQVFRNLGVGAMWPAFFAPVMTAFLSWKLATTLSRRLFDLRQATDHLGQGDLSVRVRMAGDDEFVALARSFNDMAARLEEDQQTLERRMRTDYLTGIPNRYATEEKLGQLLSQEDRRDFHILHIDLDKFKQANDTFGHECGDAVLCEIARRLQSAVMPAEAGADAAPIGFVGRIGGDEFIAIIPDLGQEQTLEFANDLIMRLNEPVRFNREPIHVGASIGIAGASAEDSDLDPGALLALADIAMYEAKRKSGNATVVLDSVLRDRGRAERALLADIGRGLDAGEFVPYLQPQVDLRNGEVVGFEVLARWHHPQKGVRVPGEFLLGLRDKDMLNMIDQSIRRSAMSWFAAARRDRPELGQARIGINVGQHQMADGRLVRKLQNLLQHTGLPAGAVAIEILENTLIDERSQQLHVNLQELLNNGFALELDDFGTGYSSMSNLLGFSVNRIKIDRSFVANIDRDGKRKLIVSAIVGIGHAFGAEVLAEGVETSAELAALRILGCDSVQGFHIAEPMEIAALETWLDQRRAGARATIMTMAS